MKKNWLLHMFIYEDNRCLFGQSYFLIFFLFSLQSSFVRAQSNIGIPFVTNFEKKTYQGGTQTWDIAQDKYQRMLFANNDGLLVFDGSTWERYPLPNKTITRSLCVIGERIYVGGQSEVGYFEANEKGHLTYHSLLSLIPKEHQQFADVWDILEHDSTIFFRTRDKVLVLSGETIEIHESKGPLFYMEVVNNRLYVQDEQIGLMEYSQGQFIQIDGGSFYKNKEIKSILNTDTGILVCTDRDGIYIVTDDRSELWRGTDQSFFKKNRIYCAQQLMGGDIAIGTSLAGMVIINETGEINQQLTSEDGLQSGTVLSIGADQYQNIWVGLNNGIDYIKVSSPFYQILPDGDLKGTGYATKVFKDKIYFGTSNGLYVNDWKRQYTKGEQTRFKAVQNSSGQVWNLNEIDGSLLMGHHDGGFEIKNNVANQFSTVQGAWIFKPIKKDLVLQGNYSGLALCEKQGNTWEFLKQSESLKESARFLAKSKNNDYWVSHPYRGIFRIQLDSDNKNVNRVNLYGAEDGLPSQLLNSVFEVGGDVLFAGEHGIYNFNTSSERFEKNESFTKLFDKEAHVKKLQEDPQGNIWYILDDKVGKVHINQKALDLKISMSSFPELTDKMVGGFEMIYPYDEENIFFGAEQGFIHFSPSKLGTYNTDIGLNIKGFYLSSNKDSLICGGYHLNPTTYTFEHEENSLRFHYAAPYYPDLQHIQYQTYLEGFDQDWSAKSSKVEKEYINLKAGEYTFNVRAINRHGSVSPVKQIAFEVRPPWYQSKWAYAIYCLAGLLLLLGLIFIPRRRFNIEKQLLEEKQAIKEQAFQQEIEEAEKEVIRARNEKLRAEIQHQNSALASITMHLVQKSELLTKIRQNLTDVAKRSKDRSSSKEIEKLVRLLAHDEHLDKDWEQFTTYFDQVHSNFFRRLRERFPQLTPKDRKLCAYLRMNLTTKEIAPLMNISVRGVEISRYRLRKKLELNSAENLTEFMIRF